MMGILPGFHLRGGGKVGKLPPQDCIMYMQCQFNEKVKTSRHRNSSTFLLFPVINYRFQVFSDNVSGPSMHTRMACSRVSSPIRLRNLVSKFTKCDRCRCHVQLLPLVSGWKDSVPGSDQLSHWNGMGLL